MASILREVIKAFNDSETRWMVFPCVAIYFGTFTFLQHYYGGCRFARPGNPDLWLVCTILIVTFAYVFNYSTASGSVQALTLLGGAALGKGASMWSAWWLAERRWR
jgi:hypothetical protein